MSVLDTEVLVVGSGAGGATTALALAEGGRSVLVVEEGPDVPPGSLVPFVLIILRYAFVLETEERRGPEEIVLEDRVIQVLGLLWAATFAAGVYLGHTPPLVS